MAQGSRTNLAKNTTILLRKPVGYQFYLQEMYGWLGWDKYSRFIQDERTESYKNLIANSIYDTNMLTNWAERQDENILNMMKVSMEDLFEKERDMIKVFSQNLRSGNSALTGHIPKMDGYFVVNQMENLKTSDDIEKFEKADEAGMEQYFESFNHYMQSIFLNKDIQKKKVGKKDKLNWVDIAEELEGKVSKGKTFTYDDFLYVLTSISREGGFETAYKFNLNSISKNIQDFIENFYTIDDSGKTADITGLSGSIKKYFESIFKGSDLTGAAKILVDGMTNFWADKTVANRKKFDKKSDDMEKLEENIFLSIIAPLVIKEIQVGYKKKAKGTYSNTEFKLGKIFIEYISETRFWRRFFQDLKKANFSLLDITFFGTEKNQIITTALKGDFGEMLQAVLSVNRGFKTTYLGSKTSNAEITTQQSITDTLIEVEAKDGRNYKYGIQDKELKFVGKINTKLYEETESKINLGDPNNVLLRYFSRENICLLAALVELADVDGIDHDNDVARFNAILSHLSLERLRIVDYAGVRNATFDAINQDDIVYNLIYRITGYYYPASYILYQRFLSILNQSKGNVQHYSLYDIDLGPSQMNRNKNMATNWKLTHGSYGQPYLDQLSEIGYNEAKNLVGLITLSTK